MARHKVQANWGVLIFFNSIDQNKNSSKQQSVIR